jgi:uncharacterized integral membrane protein
MLPCNHWQKSIRSTGGIMATPEEKNKKPEANTKPTTPETPKQGKSTLKDWVSIILGAVLVILYLVFLFLMRNLVNADELVWTRSVYLLSGLEAIAFAAAGYFFGSEVNRKAAESAKEDAETAKTEAKTAKEGQIDAEKKFVEARTQGLALKQVILAKSQSSKFTDLGNLSFGTRTKGVKVPGVTSKEPSDTDDLVNFANSLFTD